MSEKKQGNKKVAMLSAAFYFIGAVIIYILIFSNTDKVIEILKSQSYYAPLMSMVVVVLVSFLYGSAVSNLLKHTLQERLKSVELREE